jgi:hypothetical protein
MRIRRVLLGGATVVALATAGIGVSAGVAQANPGVECSRYLALAQSNLDQGRYFNGLAYTLTVTGFPDLADQAHETALAYFGAADSYSYQYIHNCQVP